jgi:hypothetical protein
VAWRSAAISCRGNQKYGCACVLSIAGNIATILGVEILKLPMKPRSSHTLEDDSEARHWGRDQFPCVGSCRGQSPGQRPDLSRTHRCGRRGELVCEYRRVFTRSNEPKSATKVYDWRHYLAVIQRKPGALRNGAPFAELPPAF